MFRVSLSLFLAKRPWEYTYLPIRAFMSLQVFPWLLKSENSQDHLATHNSLLWFHGMYVFQAAIRNIGAKMRGHRWTQPSWERNLEAYFWRLHGRVWCGDDAFPFLCSLKGLPLRVEPLLFTSFQKIPLSLGELNNSGKESPNITILIILFESFGNARNVLRLDFSHSSNDLKFITMDMRSKNN